MNWHEARTEQQLREANEALQNVNDQLSELNQPPEVRAALQEARVERARAVRWGVRLALGLGVAWVVLSLLFGGAGARLFNGLLSFLLDTLGVLIVVGCFVWIGGALWRGALWVGGRGESRP